MGNYNYHVCGISKEHIACPVLYGSATGISCLEEGGHHYDLGFFFKDIENRVRWGNGSVVTAFVVQA